MNKISIILIARNESKNIAKWGRWIHKLKTVSELVVIKLSIKTYTRDLNNNFSAQRQFAVEQTTNNLILWLDADESLSDNLIEYINNIDTHQYVNYAFKRADIFLGTTLHHGETATQYFLRLFDKRYGYFSGQVHELWVRSKPTIKVSHEIIHPSHTSLTSFFEKINYYSEIRSQELFQSRTKVGLTQIIFYPFWKFIQDYFLRLGFLDGTPGIILALGMSFHSFLVRAKLWCLYNP